MARQWWWKTCTLSSFLGFSLSLWRACWFRAPHFDRYFGACPGKSSTKSQKVWTVKQPKGRHRNCECTECVVAFREERKMRSFKGLRDWCSDGCDGQVFHAYRVPDQGWVSQCSTREMQLHAGKHICSSSTQTTCGQQDTVTGRGWGWWGAACCSNTPCIGTAAEQRAGSACKRLLGDLLCSLCLFTEGWCALLLIFVRLLHLM